jgi:NADH-quinone oxidoreductase subunit L
MTHAFFKALLFLGAGSVIHAMHHEQDMRKMGGLHNKLKITHITMLVACIAIAGIPPFSGFFSKDEILAAAFSKNIIYWIGGVIGAGITAYYMFRLYAMTFRGKFRGTPEQESHLHESPASMTIPLIILAILSIGAGFLGIPAVFAENAHALGAFLAPVFAESEKIVHLQHPSHSTEYILMGVSIAIAAIMGIYALVTFSKKTETEEPTGIGKAMANAWYVDKIYDNLITKPLHRFSNFLNIQVEKNLIDWIVNGAGKMVQYGGRQFRWMQSGQVGSYILLMVIGMLLLLVLQFILKK